MLLLLFSPVGSFVLPALITPAFLIRQLDRMLARFGENIVLHRLTTDGDGVQTAAHQATIRASVRAHRPQALDESEAPSTKAVISPTGLSAALWPGLPAKDDRVVFQDDRRANVDLVSPIYVGGVLVRVDLEWRE